jgi:hypothetical protein
VSPLPQGSRTYESRPPPRTMPSAIFPRYGKIVSLPPLPFHREPEPCQLMSPPLPRGLQTRRAYGENPFLNLFSGVGHLGQLTGDLLLIIGGQPARGPILRRAEAPGELISSLRALICSAAWGERASAAPRTPQSCRTSAARKNSDPPAHAQPQWHQISLSNRWKWPHAGSESQQLIGTPEFRSGKVCHTTRLPVRWNLFQHLLSWARGH